MQKLFVILLICTAVTFTSAQTCPDGQFAFQRQEYEKALAAFSDCLKKAPNDSALMFMNGYINVLLKAYKKAIPLLEKSIELNYKPAQNTQFAIGYCYAALGEKDKSISYLQKAATGGFANFTRLDSIQFDALRNLPTFANIKKNMYENAFPCLKDSNNNKFDFWLGEWEVYQSNQKIADSKITKAKGGCAVHEDYVVLSGLYAGQSISYYDPTEKRWEQYWVGSAGDKSKYYETENYKEDMQFIWKRTNPNGSEFWTKMSYVAQDENTVIQTLVSSTDQGATWNASFSGTYKRKK